MRDFSQVDPGELRSKERPKMFMMFVATLSSWPSLQICLCCARGFVSKATYLKTSPTNVGPLKIQSGV